MNKSIVIASLIAAAALAACGKKEVPAPMPAPAPVEAPMAAPVAVDPPAAMAAPADAATATFGGTMPKSGDATTTEADAAAAKAAADAAASNAATPAK